MAAVLKYYGGNLAYVLGSDDGGCGADPGRDRRRGRPTSLVFLKTPGPGRRDGDRVPRATYRLVAKRRGRRRRSVKGDDPKGRRALFE